VLPLMLVEKFGPIPPSPLCPIECKVSFDQEITGVPIGISRHRDSHTCRTSDLHAAHGEWGMTPSLLSMDMETLRGRRPGRQYCGRARSVYGDLDTARAL